MSAKQHIPIYSIKERAKDGLEILKVENTHDGDLALHSAHRDDHYILVFQEYGTSKVMIDFNEVTINGCAVFCILPGQVHYGISAESSLAWFIALEASWIKEFFMSLLQEYAMENAPILVDSSQAELLKNSLNLLSKLLKETSFHFQDHTLRAMADVCISMFVSCYSNVARSAGKDNLRITTITRHFKNLLMVNFRIMKSPSDYASALNISPSYLNEAVKVTTGYPVSYWIHQKIILEAKRILFYTDNTTKEIAHTLGYEDHTYFIRLFSKVAGMPPMQFRQKYRR